MRCGSPNLPLNHEPRAETIIPEVPVYTQIHQISLFTTVKFLRKVLGPFSEWILYISGLDERVLEENFPFCVGLSKIMVNMLSTSREILQRSKAAAARLVQREPMFAAEPRASGQDDVPRKFRFTHKFIKFTVHNGLVFTKSTWAFF